MGYNCHTPLHPLTSLLPTYRWRLNADFDDGVSDNKDVLASCKLHWFVWYRRVALTCLLVSWVSFSQTPFQKSVCLIDILTAHYCHKASWQLVSSLTKANAHLNLNFDCKSALNHPSKGSVPPKTSKCPFLFTKNKLIMAWRVALGTEKLFKVLFPFPALAFALLCPPSKRY